ncbi:MAG TPA: hypothetical protein VKI61_01645, partial [Chitinophagaceae bacterium]|nr:hypothetical protein [Chitinophagaceae bacterium]
KGHGFRRSQNRDEKISSILREYNNQDNLTVMEFCKFHKIHKSTFYNWRNHYANKKIGANKPKGFLPVEVTTPSYEPVSTIPTLFAEVNGIRLYHFVPADYLKVLLS